jgi:hypothetical protein
LRTWKETKEVQTKTLLGERMWRSIGLDLIILERQFSSLAVRLCFEGGCFPAGYAAGIRNPRLVVGAGIKRGTLALCSEQHRSEYKRDRPRHVGCLPLRTGCLNLKSGLTTTR